MADLEHSKISEEKVMLYATAAIEEQIKGEKNMVKKLKSFWSQYNFIVIFLGIFLIYLAINGSQTTWTSVTNIFLHSAILGTIASGMGNDYHDRRY